MTSPHGTQTASPFCFVAQKKPLAAKVTSSISLRDNCKPDGVELATNAPGAVSLYQPTAGDPAGAIIFGCAPNPALEISVHFSRNRVRQKLPSLQLFS